MCHLPKKCRGYDGMVLCEDCIKCLKEAPGNQEDKDDFIHEKEYKDHELSIFDFL